MFQDKFFTKLVKRNLIIIWKEMGSCNMTGDLQMNNSRIKGLPTTIRWWSYLKRLCFDINGNLPNVFLDRAGSLPMTGDLNMRNNRINNLNSNPQIGLDVVNKNHVDLVVRKSDLTFIYIVFKAPFPSFGLRTQNYERKNCGGSPKYYTTRDLDYLGYHKNRIYWLFY